MADRPTISTWMRKAAEEICCQPSCQEGIEADEANYAGIIAKHAPTPGGGEREAEREAFEAWAASNTDDWAWGEKQIAWAAWQAARLAPAVTLTSEEHREIEAERSYGITLFDYDDRHKDQLCIYSNNAGGNDARHELSITQREAVRQLLFISPILARLAALPKDWDRDPMPGSVRELVRDLLRMTEKEGGK